MSTPANAFVKHGIAKHLAQQQKYQSGKAKCQGAENTRVATINTDLATKTPPSETTNTGANSNTDLGTPNPKTP